ncbi:MAG: DUF4160 domain-containing protein [Vicinamibacterales bacterium]
MSPTVLRSGPYRFFFYSSDGSEPVHVHVGRDDKAAKFWLNPVRLDSNVGFSKQETRKIEGLVGEHQAELTKAWHEYFKSGK